MTQREDWFFAVVSYMPEYRPNRGNIGLGNPKAETACLAAKSLPKPRIENLEVGNSRLDRALITGTVRNSTSHEQ